MQAKNEILEVISASTGFAIDKLIALIALTDGIKGCTLVSIRGYSSDKSEHSEVASHVVNIGAAYAPMVEKSNIAYSEVDLSNIDVNKHNYSGYVIEDLDAFKAEVAAALPIALAELLAPKETKERVSNDIWLNKALVFNTNTMQLSIFGQSLNKTVTVKGEYKLVKSAPKTVAKKIISDYCNPKVDLLRRFKLVNLDSLKMKGEVLEIG